jgi:hypothetical protein
VACREEIVTASRSLTVGAPLDLRAAWILTVGSGFLPS